MNRTVIGVFDLNYARVRIQMSTKTSPPRNEKKLARKYPERVFKSTSISSSCRKARFVANPAVKAAAPKKNAMIACSGVKESAVRALTTGGPTT